MKTKKEIHKYYVISTSARAAIEQVKSNSSTNIFTDRDTALAKKRSILTLIPEFVFEVVESYTAEEVVDTSIQYGSIP